ncbi:MAG: DUF3054 domain-containing protein [Chloroflexota bacterium]
MAQSKNQAIKSQSLRDTLVLAAGDLLALLLFVLIGRGSHSLAVTDIRADLAAAAPFILSWFLISPWFGLFRAGVSRNWRQWVPRLLLAWAVMGCPAALIGRALWLGRPIPGGIPLSFAAVTLTVTSLLLLLWRLGYLWWVSRRSTGQDSQVV